MGAALYDPEGGYYARGSRQVGREGDFFTSVSTGPVFGRLLAERIAAWHRENGSPARWRVVELGAHDASLALDILRGLEELGLAGGCHYAILEPLENLAAVQRGRLMAAGVQAQVYSSPDDLAAEPLPTYLLANEVLDALPCHLLESDGTGWQETGVGVDEGGNFTWRNLGPAPSWADALPLRPAGYRTEIRPGLAGFFLPLLALLKPGRMLWIDYGFPHSVYYDEARSTGTLRTYYRHRAGENPLELPGGQDITAHVDFTAAATALRRIGGRITLFEDQGRFLTRLAAPWLLAREGRTDAAVRKELLAFQTLIHPGHLGARFHFLEASFGEEGQENAETLGRLELG